MIGLPPELLSIVGIAVVGYIGSAIITELGGKLISVSWNIICYSSGTLIGLKYAWDMMHKVYAIVTHF